MGEQESATVAPVAEPAPAATTPEAPKPEATPEPDWKAAYTGIQRSLNKRDQHIDNLLSQNQALLGAVETLKGDVDVVLKQSLGEEGLKVRQAERQIAQERQQALAAVETSKAYVAASIGVWSDTMRAAGVPEKDIEQVWQAAGNAGTVAEWADVAKSASASAIAKAANRAAEQVKAKSQEQIKAEAQALAEHTVRSKGIDKVDLGRGQSMTPERSLVERIRSIDRNTTEGEAQWQSLRKDVMRGTLKT